MSDIDWSGLREEALAGFDHSSLPPNLELPALPHAVTLFLEKSSDPEFPLRDKAAILETDTGLTLELLKYVNSSYIGLRHKASGVHQALSLLGHRQSRIFVMTTGMQAAVRAKKSRLINQNCFWNSSLQKAIFARLVARLLQTEEDVAFAGALLQDYLLPALTNHLLDPYVRFVTNRDSQPEDLCEYERSQFSWDHALAGAAIASRWQLPDELVCCVLFHHRGLSILADPVLRRSPVAAVALSALLPDQLRQHYRGLHLLKALGQKWSSFNLQELVESVDEIHSQNNLGVHNDFPLTRRCRSAFDAQSPQISEEQPVSRASA